MTDAVGQGFRRKDGIAKVTGSALYTADWPLGHISHGVIFQSTIASGKIKSFDFKKALKVPGIIDIITCENAPRIASPPKDLKESLGDPLLPFQNAQILYHGQPVGIVVASSLEAAEEAARLVQITYQASDPLLDFEVKRKEAAKKVKKDSNDHEATVRKGNADSQIKKSDVVVSGIYTIPIENHHPIEPSSTVAIWKGKNLKVYDATQGVSDTSEVLAGLFKVKKDNMQLISKFIGGGFGCKGSVWTHAVIAVLAALKTKKTVKVVTTRQQMSTNVGYRSSTVQEVTLGSLKDGELLAIKHETVNPTAVHRDYPETTGALFKLLYKSKAISSVQKLVKLNYPPPTFMRAPGECSGSFALESAMDELAHSLKLDPIELRLKNYADSDPIKEIPFSSKSLKQCYEQGALKFGWNKRKTSPGLLRVGDYFIGYGMATSSYPVHFFTSSATVELFANGTAKVLSATQDIGTGTYTVMAQLAADALGLDYEKISFDLGDSKFPQAGVSGGSSTVSSVGWAIAEASQNVLLQLKKLASKDKKSLLFGVPVKKLLTKEGRIFIDGELSRGDSFVAVLKRSRLKSLVGKGKLDEKKQKENEKKYSQHSFGAQFAEVKVHALTGEVTLVKMVGAFAAGKIVNPKTAKNQFMGGMIFGIGMGLTEHNFVDERYGKFMQTDLADYHVPVNGDVPELEIIMIDEKDTIVNPAGTKGIGEIGTVGTAAAIANAVFNATGIRVRDLPITPDKLCVELGKRL